MSAETQGVDEGSRERADEEDRMDRTTTNEAVGYDLRDGVAVIAVRNPPVNALSQAVRAGLWSAMDRAEAEARAVVIFGEGRTFIAGADISEFGKPPREPFLGALCDRIEASPLPVVAALHGTALGGGLEVAMAAHHRVAVPGAKVGLPEVLLGIMPGAGGTQRLPRLTGAEPALDLITTGRHVPAAEALELGVLDRVEEGEPEALGLAFARELLAEGASPRRTSEMPGPQPVDWDEAYDRALAKGRGQIAPAKAVRAVQASAELPFPEGLKRERELFGELMDSPQREGLIHAFFAERAVSKLPELKGVEPREVARVGVIGGGTMGSGIATACLLAGLPVTMVEASDDALARGRGTVEKNLDGAVARGKMSEAKRAAVEFDASTDMGALSQADLVVEAVFEEMDVKKDVFARLDAVAKAGAVLATNTSYLDVDEIAASTSRPSDVIGLHFFSPAHVMRLLEVVVGERTAPEVTATGFALAKRLGKVAVRAGVCDGFIGNRILSHWRTATDHMVLDGASPYQIDRALEAFGMAMGPYKVADLAGLDIGWATRKRLAPTRDPRARDATFADRLCEMGRFGRKTGRGFYVYEDGRPIEDPEVEAIVADSREGEGRACEDAEIQRRTMAAMVNEAARVVEEGIASRPLDVDVVLVHGYGFPRWRGGPMLWADREGLAGLLDDIRRYGEEDDFFWRPAPLLERLAADGRRFADLDGG